MRICALCLCLALAAPSAFPHPSQTRRVLIRVLDGNKHVIKGVRIRERLNGVVSAPSDQNGLTWILVAPDVKPGKPVPIEIVNSSGRNWLLVNPPDNIITVRPFGPAEENVIPVTVIDRADPKLLINGQLLYATAVRIVRNIKPSQLPNYLSPRQTQAVLAQEAKRLGVQPSALARALDSWARGAEDPREKATAYLYKQNFHEATTLLVPYFEQQTKKTFDVALDLAFSQYSEGFYSESAKTYEIATALRPDDFKVLNALGIIRSNLGEYEAAERLFDRSLAIMKDKLAPNDPEIAATWSNKGSLFLLLSKFKEARQATDNAFSILKAKFGPNSPRMYVIYNDYGNLYQYEGKHSLAKQNYIKSLQLLGTDKTKVAQYDYLWVLIDLASAERDNGEFDEADVDFKKALQLAKKLVANGTIRQEHPIIGRIHNEYSGVFGKKQMFDDAEKEILQARDIWSKSLGENHRSFATALNNLASNYIRTKRAPLALPLLKRAVSINEKALGLDNPVTGISIGKSTLFSALIVIFRSGGKLLD